MALYSIAGFTVDIENMYDYLPCQCIGYEYNGSALADLTVRVTDEELRRERLISDSEYSNGYLESVCAYRKLCLSLPVFGAVLLHASVISFEDKGIAFLAPSGVGKTTHTMLWQQRYKNSVTVINGDKPIIRFYNGIPYAYGTPWAGKENMQTNTKVRLTDLCFIERCRENIAASADKRDCITLLMRQVLHPSDPETAIKTLDLLNELIEKCRLWTVKCNMSVQAAQVAHDIIIGDIDQKARI